MSFTVNPVFSFRLNQTIVGQIKFGKFDGIHVCLTAATSTDKVSILATHKPYLQFLTRTPHCSGNHSQST